MIPDPIRLFHITAIDNLDVICQSGNLVCKNGSTSQGINYQNIAHSGAQGARAVRQVPDPPGGTIHDFVPFYFPVSYMTRIGVIDDTKAQIVSSILAGNGVELSVEVMKDWYFLGQ